MVFDKIWFEKNQSLLVKVLNLPLVGRVFRFLLKINTAKRIVGISPNSFTVLESIGVKDVTVTTDFRTHDKYAKRLYYSLKPLWYLLHFLDWAGLEKLNLGFGFSTLTQYPDAGTGATTFDCAYYATGSNVAWATLRGSATASSSNASSTNDIFVDVQTGVASGWETFGRAGFLFDTSALTSAALISAATLSLYITSTNNGNSLSSAQSDTALVTFAPASNNSSTNTDFATANWGTTDLATRMGFSGITTSAYNAFTLNASGISNISLTSISKFGVRLGCDVDNSEPTRNGSELSCFLIGDYADKAGTTSDPKLEVTYTLSLGAKNLLTLGVG